MNELITPSIYDKEEVMLGVFGVLSKCRAFKLNTGKTQGIRLRIRPARNAMII